MTLKWLKKTEDEEINNIIKELSDFEIIHLINFSYPATIASSDYFYSKNTEVLRPVSRELSNWKENQKKQENYKNCLKHLYEKGLTRGLTYKEPFLTDLGKNVVNAIYDEEDYKKDLGE